MATFGLVHGAWHGAWAWDLLIPELEMRGHSAVAIDLPCEEPDARFDDYADAVIRSLPDVPDIILVSHSLGGITIPLIADRRHVACMVFLCALVPHVVNEPTLGEPRTHEEAAFAAVEQHPDGSRRWPSAEAVARILYQDCPAELASSAFARLRSQQRNVWLGLAPLDRLPDTRMVSIVCSDDRAIRPEWSRWVASERLGVEAMEMPGDHSPMMSRPTELADVLAQIADTLTQVENHDVENPTNTTAKSLGPVR